jgi:predicted metal-binding protein
VPAGLIDVVGEAGSAVVDGLAEGGLDGVVRAGQFAGCEGCGGAAWVEPGQVPALVAAAVPATVHWSSCAALMTARWCRVSRSRSSLGVTVSLRGFGAESGHEGSGGQLRGRDEPHPAELAPVLKYRSCGLSR